MSIGSVHAWVSKRVTVRYFLSVIVNILFREMSVLFGGMTGHLYPL